MALVISAIMTSVFAVVIAQGIDAWVFMRGHRSILSDVRSGLHRISRELVTVRDSASGLAVMGTNECQIIDQSGSTITFRQSGTELLRNGAVLVEHLDPAQGLVFSYLNGSGEAVSDAAEVRVIVFDLLAVEGNNRAALRGAAGVRNR